MYMQKCIQCDELKNLLDEKGIQYNYLDMMEMPHKTMTYLKMYCNSFPIVLNINHLFSDFEVQYNYLDMMEMPHKTMTYLRMYCNSFPIVLNIIIYFQILKSP